MSLELETQEEGRVLVVTVSGRLAKEDYDRLVPQVDELVKTRGKIRILFVMHDFHGWKAAALWEDTKFAVRHFHDIERLAMVGERPWQKGMAIFCKPFTKAEVRYFTHSERQNAGNWLHEDSAVHS